MFGNIVLLRWDDNVLMNAQADKIGRRNMEQKNIPIERRFAVIAFIVGGILLFITPPMAAPDENDHFYNMYAFSDADFFADSQGNLLGRMLPVCIIDFVNNYNEKFAAKLNEQYNFSEAYTSWAIPSDFEEYRFVPYWNSNVNLIGYLPSGTGIVIYRILAATFPFICMSPYNLLLFGRICNLTFYIVIMYYALKWTPILKYTIFLSALFPMSLFLASTLSYDTVIIGFCTLLFSRIMNILSSTRIITRKDLIVISVCFFFLVNVKTAYAPLLIALFSLPVTRFSNVKRYIKYIVIVVSTGIIPFVLFNVGKNIGLKNFTWKYTAAMNEQTKVILSDPVNFVNCIVNSFVKYGKFYYLGSLGSLGQQDTNLPEVFLYILTFITLFVALIEISSQDLITVKFKILSLIGIFLTIYAVFAGTYIIWTGTRYEIGLDYVEGCQGRYFIPLLIWVTVFFSNSSLKKRRRIFKLVEKLSVGIVIFMLIITLICVFIRFWIHNY